MRQGLACASNTFPFCSPLLKACCHPGIARQASRSEKDFGLLGLVPPHPGVRMTQSLQACQASTRALDFIVRETKSFCRRHSCPWGDKDASCLSFCHLPCPDKAQRLLAIGGQDKFRRGRFRASGDLFAAVALRRERTAWLVCPLFSGRSSHYPSKVRSQGVGPRCLV